MQAVEPSFRHDQGGALVPSGTVTSIFGPVHYGTSPHKAFAVANQSAYTLSGAIIQVNPDRHGVQVGTALSDGRTPAPNASLWVNLDTTTFQTLSSGQCRVVAFADRPYPWWRIVAVNDQPPSLGISGWGMAQTI